MHRASRRRGSSSAASTLRARRARRNRPPPEPEVPMPVQTETPPARPAFLGILLLDTRFPRPPGDVGNAQTFERAGIPVRFTAVAGASPKRIVEEADPAWLQPFIDAAAKLVDE